jgi:hypothetical protein
LIASAPAGDATPALRRRGADVKAHVQRPSDAQSSAKAARSNSSAMASSIAA